MIHFRSWAITFLIAITLVVVAGWAVGSNTLAGDITAVGIVMAYCLLVVYVFAAMIWLVFVQTLAYLLIRHNILEPPDLVVGSALRPYLLRWELWRPFGWQVALHQIRRSDDDRALHDHVGWHCSVILRGSYIEHFEKRSHLRRLGSVVFRPATKLHRLELPVIDGKVNNVWTLWIRGPKVREWGFQTPEGWMDWRAYGRKYGEQL